MKHSNTKLFPIGFIVSAFALSTAPGLSGEIIYDTFGPAPYVPDVNSHSVFWQYSSGSGVGGGRSIATPFDFSGTDFELDSITLDLRSNGAPEAAPNLRIGIYHDAGGSPSLTPVASLDPIPTLVGPDRQAITYSFPSNSILNRNIPYWLVLEPRISGIASENYDAYYLISASTYRPTGGVSVRELGFPSGGSDWTYYAAAAPVFRLTGTAVPEPGTWALLGLGGLAFWSLARRRH